jgi:hypothetical protein
MRVLFDQGTPAPLRHVLVGHEVSTAFELGWATLKNGELLAAAESLRFDVFITTDTNLKYQQNLKSRRIAIVVLGTTSWPRIKIVPERIVSIVNAATAGSYAEIAIP